MTMTNLTAADPIKMGHHGDAPGEHRNIARVTAIVEALAASSQAGLRLVDIVEQTGLGKTTAHRLLSGLSAAGLVEQDDETARFYVGSRILSWATAARDRFSFARLAEPALERIAQQTQDTIYLVARAGSKIVCLDSREGSFPIKVLTLAVGDRRPLGIGAGSLSILAALADDEIDRLFEVNRAELASYPFDEVRLRQMIREARRNGYAYNNTHVLPGLENVTDMAGIGVPICRRDGTPVAALHLTAITPRLDGARRENVVAGLLKEAGDIEKLFEAALEFAPVVGRRAVRR
jgi:DNA-binding IclR family transcriptional regulator